MSRAAQRMRRVGNQIITPAPILQSYLAFEGNLIDTGIAGITWINTGTSFSAFSRNANSLNSLFVDNPTNAWIYIKSNSVNIIDYNIDFTFDMYIYPKKVSTALGISIFNASQQSITKYRGVEISILGSNYGTAGLLQVAMFFSDSTLISIKSTSIISLNSWTRISVERLGQLLSIYINGVLESSITIPLNKSILPTITSSYLGSFAWSAIDNFDGYIDDFSII